MLVRVGEGGVTRRSIREVSIKDPAQVEEQRNRRHRHAAAVRGEAPGGCAGAALRFTALVSSNVC